MYVYVVFKKTHTLIHENSTKISIIISFYTQYPTLVLHCFIMIIEHARFETMYKKNIAVYDSAPAGSMTHERNILLHPWSLEMIC